MIEAVDLSIIALYFGGSLAVGYWASRQIKTADDYAIAGGKLKYPVLLGTLIATSIGASATMGRAGKAYEVGVAIFFAGIAYAVGLWLFSYLAPIIKRMQIWSVPEALELRYGRTFKLLAALVILTAIIGIFSAQLIAFGVVVIALLPNSGLTFEQVVIASALVMVVYTALGGLLAVAYTDLIQAVIMIVVVGMILPFTIVMDIGGPGVALSQLTPPTGNLLGGMTVVYIVSIFLIDVPFSLLDVSLWQRTGAAKSIDHIRKGIRITAVTFIAWSFIVVALGVFAANLMPNLADTPAGPDAAIPQLVMNYMPPVIKGLCIAALLAVIMSTADTVLLIGSTTVSLDICNTLIDDFNERKKIWTARWTVLGIGILGVFLAFLVSGVFEVLLVAFAVYVGTLFVPTMAAILWKRATTWGAIASTSVAFVTILWLYSEKFAGNLPTSIEPIIVSQALSLIIMVIVSLSTYRADTATSPLIYRSHE